MKQFALSLIVAAFTLTGCADMRHMEQVTAQAAGSGSIQNSDGSRLHSNNSGSPQLLFASMYPAARKVEWECERGMFKVEFIDGNHEKEAWFLSDGTWVRTITELFPYEVPAVVIDAIRSRIGSAWRIDDIYLIEQPAEPCSYYLAECEMHDTDIYIKVSADGTLLSD